MDKSWFDRESGTLLLDNHAVELGPYQRIVENEMTTDAELDEQTQRATAPITWYAISGLQGGVA